MPVLQEHYMHHFAFLSWKVPQLNCHLESFTMYYSTVDVTFRWASQWFSNPENAISSVGQSRVLSVTLIQPIFAPVNPLALIFLMNSYTVWPWLSKLLHFIQMSVLSSNPHRYYSFWIIFMHLRGNCTPNQKLVCFVLCLKIINTFLENNICILTQIVQGTQKWHWNFSRPSSF